MNRKILLWSLTAASILIEASYVSAVELESRPYYGGIFPHTKLKPDAYSSPKRSANSLTVFENREAKEKYSQACEIKKRKSEPLEKAVELLRESANKGYPPAQYDLAVMLLNGQGCKKNVVEATDWYKKAAQQKYGPAENALGFIYEFGNEAVKQDLQNAQKWYGMAALDNFPLGKENLHRLKKDLEQ